MLRLIRYIIITGLGFALVISGISFGSQNNSQLTIRFFKWSWELPVYGLCLIFLAGGVLLACLVLAGEMIRLYTQNIRLRRQIRRLLQNPTAPPASGSNFQQPS